MQVCKLFLKIIKKNIGLFLLYIGIFSFITVFMITSQNQSTTYSKQKISTYVLIEEETKETEDLLSFLDSYIKRVNLKGEKEVDDALFWDDIDLYLFIPKDFLSKVLNEEEAFTKKSAPDSLEAETVISTLQTFLNLVNENIRLGICTEEDAISYTIHQFQNEDSKEVILRQKNGTGLMRGMYDLAVYIICSLMLLIVGLVSFNLRKLDINRRLRISPYSTGRRNLMLGICFSTFAILFVGIITCIGMCIFPTQINSRIWLYILNTCLFAITMVFMALFLSSLFKSDMAYSCVASVLPLVAAFLCGSFVGIDLLPDATKIVGHIFPNIYIVLGNQYIETAEHFNFGSYLTIVWPCFLFIGIFILGSIFVTNHISKSEN